MSLNNFVFLAMETDNIQEYKTYVVQRFYIAEYEIEYGPRITSNVCPGASKALVTIPKGSFVCDVSSDAMPHKLRFFITPDKVLHYGDADIVDDDFCLPTDLLYWFNQGCPMTELLETAINQTQMHLENEQHKYMNNKTEAQHRYIESMKSVLNSMKDDLAKHIKL